VVGNRRGLPLCFGTCRACYGTTARHNHNANQRAGCWLYCLVLSVGAAAFFVAPPRFSFGIESLSDLLTTFLFVLLTFCSVILIAGMHFGIERYRELNHQSLRQGTVAFRRRGMLDYIQLESGRTRRTGGRGCGCSTRRWNNTARHSAGESSVSTCAWGISPTPYPDPH
jgi:hypothetical protein